MYKAVVSDLDGTLLNTDHRVSEYTRRVIQAVSQKGVKFILASGRHYEDVRYISKLLELQIFLITSNGARVHNRRGQVIYQQDIAPELVDALLNLEIDSDLHVNVYTDAGWLVEHPREVLLQYHRDSGFHYTMVNFETISRSGVPKIFFHGEARDLLDLESKLELLLTNKASLTYSTPNSLEIMALGVSKGNALRDVLRQKDIRPEETVAFGDGPNDIDMLQTVGRGVVMGNAQAELKDVLSGYEITGTNDEDGVAKYLEALFL